MSLRTLGLGWIGVLVIALYVAHPALLVVLGDSMGVKMQGSVLTTLLLPGAAAINFTLSMRAGRSTGLPGGAGRRLLGVIAAVLGSYTILLALAYARAGWMAPDATTDIMGAGLAILLGGVALSTAAVGWMTGLNLPEARDATRP